MTTAIPISQALTDPNLLGAALGPSRSWSTWVSVLKCAFGERLSRSDRRALAAVAGDRKPPRHRVRELFCICGRRGGKSRIAAAIAAYIATCVNHSATLTPGERGTILVLAGSQGQAATVFNYVVGFINASPILAGRIEGITASEVRLHGNIVVAVHPNSFRSVRGKTLLAVVADEASYWRDESSANPDVELYRAVLPSLTSTGGMWIAISTGYRRAGLMYTKWRDHFGKSDDAVLCVQGSSQTFNPLLDLKAIAAAKAADPEASEAEWGGGFREDIATFLSDEVIEAAIARGRQLELPPRLDVKYRSFVDMSGGRHDASVLCIGHLEDGKFVADVIRGRPAPHDPGEVVAEFADLLRAYGVARVWGDNFGAEWVASAFRSNSVQYWKCPIAKSQIYLEVAPAFNRHLIEIPDIPKLTRELRLLERRVHRSGRDSVDHGTTANDHDDFANAMCGAALMTLQPREPPPTYFGSYGAPVVRSQPSRLQQEAMHWSVPSTIPADPMDPEGISRTFPRGFLK